MKDELDQEYTIDCERHGTGKPDLAHLLEATLMTPAAPKLDKVVSLAQDVELLSDFVVEAREHMVQVEAQLLLLDADPRNVEALAVCFRAFHTIKGLAGFLEFGALERFCHEVETLLESTRSGSLEVTPRVVDALLAASDYVSGEINLIELRTAGNQVAPTETPQALLKIIQDVTANSATSMIERVTNARAVEEPIPSSPAVKMFSDRRLLKVDTAKLDHLVEAVGELVIAQSLVRNDPLLTAANNPRLNRNLSQLGRIIGDLQKATLSMRMVPIGQLFARMNRLVRDLARKSGKPTELEITGEEIELDRNIVEELGDPLMHMVRNAIDHGIESPSDRCAAGKSEIARIRLSAAHRAGNIVVQVSDDGRGLDRNKIVAKAEARGLVVPGVEIPDSLAFGLIFEPGFSTAEQVTDLSGRGVGMDVVRKQIHKLRGRIETHSERGVGATFTLQLPLTLAIIDGLVVSVGSTKFLLPISSIREVIKPQKEMISTIENRSEVAVIRDQIIPVVRLSTRFDLSATHDNIADGLLIVIESNERAICVAVDDLLGKQEVVIKSLGHLASDVPGIAGGAILADGKVGLLLDPDALRSGTRGI